MDTYNPAESIECVEYNTDPDFGLGSLGKVAVALTRQGWSVSEMREDLRNDYPEATCSAVEEAIYEARKYLESLKCEGCHAEPCVCEEIAVEDGDVLALSNFGYGEGSIQLLLASDEA